MYTYMYIHVSTWPEAPLLLFSCSVVSDSFATPWTVDHQAPLSMGFSRKEYWSGLPFPSLEELPDPMMELASLVSPALAGRFFTTAPPRKSTEVCRVIKFHEAKIRKHLV